MLLRVNVRKLKGYYNLQGFLMTRSAATEGGKEVPNCFTGDLFAVGKDTPQPKVVVIGAGMSGLSAAERLVTSGIRDVTVLEALSRPGGRINTLLIDGSPLELGATVIKGVSPGNPVFTLACEEGVVKSAAESITGDLCLCMDSDGRPIKGPVFQAAKMLFSEMIEGAQKEFGKAPSNVNLWTYFSRKIETLIRYFPHCDREMAKKAIFSLTDMLKVRYGVELNKMPLSKFGLLKPLTGRSVLVENGLSNVLKPLLRKTKDSIKFNRVVKKILWDPRRTGRGVRATIYTCDNEKYDADYVITTLPLGVLKDMHGELFEPALPECKTRAIGNLGRGHLNSVCIKYKKPFWFPGEGCIRVCWPPELMVKGHHWTHSIGYIGEISRISDTLKMIVSGDAAEHLETLPDDQIICDVNQVVRRFLGDSSLPRASHVLRSRWSSDDRFRGGTSYLGADSGLRDLNDLETPIPEELAAPVLMFAGDATAGHNQDTLHGARLAGIREAERILKLTKCFAGRPPVHQLKVCA